MRRKQKFSAHWNLFLFFPLPSILTYTEKAWHTTIKKCVRCDAQRREASERRASERASFFPFPFSSCLSTSSRQWMNEWKNIFQFKSTSESNWTWRMFIARHQNIIEIKKSSRQSERSISEIREITSCVCDSVQQTIDHQDKKWKVMAPTMGLNNNNGNGQNGDSPLSKTYQYRKIMKPMLERKRRARINRCLDELKELITGALQNVSWTSNNDEWKADAEKADAFSCHIISPWSSSNGTSLIANYLIVLTSNKLISSLICYRLDGIINYFSKKFHQTQLHSCGTSRVRVSDFSHNLSSRLKYHLVHFFPSLFSCLFFICSWSLCLLITERWRGKHNEAGKSWHSWAHCSTFPQPETPK